MSDSTPSAERVNPDECPVCGDVIRSGQAFVRWDDERRAHSSCFDQLRDIADQHLSIDHMEKVVALEAAAALRPELAGLVNQLVSERIADAIAAATRDAIPNKSTALRRLMTHAADGLDRWVETETKLADYKQMNPGVVAAMVEAATVLRTVAIYVSDDEAESK